MEEVIYNKLHEIFNENASSSEKIIQLAYLLFFAFIVILTVKIISKIIELIFGVFIKYFKSIAINLFTNLGRFRLVLINVFIINELERLINKQVIYLSLLEDKDRLEDEVHTSLWMGINTLIYGSILIIVIYYIFNYFNTQVDYIAFIPAFIIMILNFVSYFLTHLKLKRYSKNISDAHTDLNQKFEMYLNMKKLFLPKNRQ
ncbi:MAG: hypothetical protein U0T77_00335 [Chitinophagales bacterium]